MQANKKHPNKFVHLSFFKSVGIHYCNAVATMAFQEQKLFVKVLMTFLFQSPCLCCFHIHLKIDCSVTWANTLLRAAINTFCQKLQPVPDISSITIYIKQRAFYDYQLKKVLLWLCWRLKRSVSEVQRYTGSAKQLHLVLISNRLILVCKWQKINPSIKLEGCP